MDSEFRVVPDVLQILWFQKRMSSALLRLPAACEILPVT